MTTDPILDIRATDWAMMEWQRWRAFVQLPNGTVAYCYGATPEEAKQAAREGTAVDGFLDGDAGAALLARTKA